MPPLCPAPRQNRSDTTSRFTRPGGGWGSGADSRLYSTPGPADPARRGSKTAPQKPEGGGEAGLARFCALREPPRGLGEPKSCLQLHPFQSAELWEAASPVREIRFGSAGSPRNPHASDLKERGSARKKLATNVKITQPGARLPGTGLGEGFLGAQSWAPAPKLAQFHLKAPVRPAPSVCARSPIAPQPQAPPSSAPFSPISSSVYTHTHTRILLAGLDF